MNQLGMLCKLLLQFHHLQVFCLIEKNLGQTHTPVYFSSTLWALRSHIGVKHQRLLLTNCFEHLHIVKILSQNQHVCILREFFYSLNNVKFSKTRENEHKTNSHTQRIKILLTMALTAQFLCTLLPRTPKFPVFPSICRLRVSVGLTVSRFRTY